MLTKLLKSSVSITTGLILSTAVLCASIASAEVVDPQMELLVQELRTALGDDDSVKSLLTRENTDQTANIIEPGVAVF
jgi:hypothetical protein